ncbi:porin family protein [Sphingomonas aracearum]|uniref:DUF560 domain-containing protein n=1 Tax=Sphingomonas aracearum TaxID=2283317 RepID=A0A369VX29_9SPHN|nr:porin family protein [Sphingomonas aracearum]RDE05632.1 DUF560 domain-containing protein [Sphingomonas aracearum]
MMFRRGVPCVALALLSATPALADEAPGEQTCANGTCQVRLTPAQVLARAEQLVRAGQFEEAKPLLLALLKAPGYTFQARYLAGYSAMKAGKWKSAAGIFRRILVEDPGQTQVRLDYGRVLLAMGKTASADHQLRLAGEAQDLPPEVARTIRSVRNIIRSRRAWSLNVDFGIAPDSNINNATGSDTVTILFGNQPIPLSLDKAAQAKSGLGITGSFDGSLRLPIAKDGSKLWLVDVNGFGTQYKGSSFDDLYLEAATGPEFKLSERARVRIEGLVAERDYGNRIASRQAGVKGGAELTVGQTNRLGLQFDLRRTWTRFDDGYSGWQGGLYATYERVVAKSLIASASLFARRDWLKTDAYSSTEVGGILGIGGELPKGFNFGISGGLSRAVYDAPLYLFANDPRRDWRYNARVTIGNRAVRVLGLSPTIQYTYGRADSSLPLFATERSRFRLTLARYF